MKDRCPLCFKVAEYDMDARTYIKFQNTERLICEKCAAEVKSQMRPTWQIISGRVFPKSNRI